MDAITKGYEYAKERYGALGVDVETAMDSLDAFPISMHCWQGDDVLGFDQSGALSGGIAATGNYPGRAGSPDELRQDIDKALSLIPGAMKLNLHASYADHSGPRVDRDALTAAHFQNWIDWAKEKGLGLDFNPTYFSHPMAESGFTLSSQDPAVRSFWIEHSKRCREIAAAFYAQLGKPCVLNFWMPDGYKDIPADKAAPRLRMVQALDEVFAGGELEGVKDAVESKLFGLGVESYTVASHELLYGYAVSRNKLYCLDAGHFHPLEYISDKISACLTQLDELLLHVSRGVRWDSDHVIILDNELEHIFQEIIRGGYSGRVHVALDFFDASINRVAAWVIGVRNAKKALLKALLEPSHTLKAFEQSGDLTSRLAFLEESRTLPFGAVWDYYLMKHDLPAANWMDEIKQYEKTTQNR